VYDKLDIEHLYIDIEDVFNADLKSIVPQIIDFMKNEANGNVLVHCTAGASRSCAAVIAFLMHKAYYFRGRPYSTHILPRVTEFVRTRRHECEPNYGFVNQLRSYENELIDRYART
jgi:protein-tyrosine phosphatase